MGESKAGKMLQDLEYEKIDEITAIADKIKNIKKTNKLFASFFLRIIAQKYLIIISRYIHLIILFLYLLCIRIFLKIFEGNIF